MTTRFVFSLQPLLDERQRKEDEMHRAFAHAKQTREDESRELDRLTGAIRAGSWGLHECAIAGGVAELRVHEVYLRGLERTISLRAARRAETATACERAAVQLLEANRERRLIEKLKERRLHESEREAERREELELQEANAR